MKKKADYYHYRGTKSGKSPVVDSNLLHFSMNGLKELHFNVRKALQF